MNTPIPNQIIREITPLSDKDCFYIAERYKTEFTYPIHNHSEFELNFTEKAAGVRRVVGDSSEVIGDYDLVLITGKDLEHVWEQNECRSKEIREITIQFSSDLFFKSFINKNQFDSIRRMLDKACLLYTSPWFEHGLHNLIHKATEYKVLNKGNGTLVLSFTVESQAPNAARIKGGTSLSLIHIFFFQSFHCQSVEQVFLSGKISFECRY